MTNKDKLQFGSWNIGGTSFTLKGILNLNEETGVLDLFSDEPLALPYNTDVVYGKTYQGGAFTLYECHIEGGMSTSIVHDYQHKYTYRIYCNYILEGANFTNEEEILMKEVYFSVTNLNRWAFQNAVEIKLDDSSEYVITTNSIDDISHKNEEFEFIITYLTLADYSYTFTSSMKVSTNVQLILKFENPTSLKRVHTIIQQIRDFFSLCIGSNTYIDYVSATQYYEHPQYGEMHLKITGEAIGFGNNEKVEELKKHHSYISLEHIKKDFNNCMKNWFEKSERFKPVIDLYLSLSYHRTSDERHFLNLVQALEAYHRLTRKNHVLPKEEHTKKIESIMANLPTEHKEWVRGKLAFSNEPSLHERLEELLTPISKSNSSEFEAKYYHLFRLRNKSKVDLIKDIKNTRNYNTHFDERLLKKSLKGEELYQLILLLSSMMKFYLLTELEIDENIVVDYTWKRVGDISTRNSIIEATRNKNIGF